MVKQKKSASPLLPIAISAAALTCVFARNSIRRRRRIDFAGKSVLITGGSRGLGLVLARQLAAEGAKLTICARTPHQLSAAADDLRRLGAEVLAVPCDVTSRAEVDALIDQIVGQYGGIDCVINNAGVIEVGPLETMTIATFEEAMKLHFWAPLFTTLAALPHLRRRGGGRVVNISSVGGKIAVPHLLPYCASKFALVGLSEGLRAELMKDNIYVTTVCPGLMRTGSPRNAMFKGQHRKEFAWFDLGSALPVTSINAVRAAREIIEATRFGRAHVVLSIPAKLAVFIHDLFPNVAAECAALANALLPTPGGIGTHRVRGQASESLLTRSPLTALDREAALANNEIDGQPV